MTRRLLIATAAATPAIASAQTQLPAGTCDFDVAGDLGRNVWGHTVHLIGRAGASTDRGQFFIINDSTEIGDVDHDGYNQPGPACDYNNLYTPQVLRRDLINVANPALAIPAQNVILISLPRRLPNGTMARVENFVEIPNGTVAGTYRGEIQIRDSLMVVRNGPNNETLGNARVYFEVTVTEDRAFAIVDPDSAAILDSLVIRGHAGQRASGVVRVANTGNANLSDVTVTATDLRSESAVGLIIPGQNVTITPANISGLLVSDTTRLTVTVQIPRGILGGRYRGSLIVQAGGTAAQQIPLIVIVTSTRGILFGNNPVREINGDIANIAFNGDPGTPWKLSIYDMAGLVAYKTSGTVFAGAPIPGGAPTDLVGADFAVNVIWPLRNGRGEGVASGMYLVVVESMVNGKRQLAQDKLMVIR